MGLYVYSADRIIANPGIFDWLVENCRGRFGIRRMAPSLGQEDKRRLYKVQRFIKKRVFYGLPFLLVYQKRAKVFSKLRGFTTRYVRPRRRRISQRKAIVMPYIKPKLAVVIVFDHDTDMILCKMRWH